MSIYLESMSSVLNGAVRMPAVFIVVLLLSSCENGGMMHISTLPEPKHPSVVQSAAKGQELSGKGNGDMTQRPKRVEPVQMLVSPSLPSLGKARLSLPKGALQLNADKLPLNRFIHMSLGDVLKLSFEIDPAVAARVDPVTLHVVEPVPADTLLGMVKEALALFDVALIRGDQGGVRVVPAAAVASAPPEIISSPPRVAKLMAQLGRVIVLIPLHYISQSEAQRFSSIFFAFGKNGNVWFNARLHAMVAVGSADAIRRYREVLQLVDRPYLKGKQMRLIHPVYWSAEEMAGALRKALKAQGVPLGEGGTQVMVFKRMNALMLTSPQKEWLNAALDWVHRFDQPQAVGEAVRPFIYNVRQGRALEIGHIVQRVIGESVLMPKKQKPQTQGKVVGAVPQKPRARSHIVIDDKRNMLVFIGTAAAYQRLLPLLQKLDRPARQVLIEATIAEVVLDDATQFGVEAGFSNVDRSSALRGALSTLGGLGVGSAGLAYTLTDLAGAVRLKINALASQGKARVLSSPRLLALDHETANIQIGDQVAVLTQEISSTQSTTAASAGLLRNFQYVDTGVILSVTPMIGDGGVVRLKVHQEVSSPGASTNNTPPISRRSVNTTLVAKSGQTVLIGGLISRQKSLTRTKVPLLGDIPLLGHLFSSDAVSSHNVELIILITPHVIEQLSDLDFMVQAYRKQMGQEQ